MSKKKITLFLLLSFACGVIASAHPPQAMGRPYTNSNWGWFARLTRTEAFARHVGINESQKQVLAEKFAKIAYENRQIDERIRNLARKQALLFKKLVSSHPDPETEKKIYNLIDQIGKFRSKQAKLSLRSLLDLRETLDREQWKRANEYIKRANRARVEQRNSGRKFEEGSKKTSPGKSGRRKDRTPVDDLPKRDSQRNPAVGC